MGSTPTICCSSSLSWATGGDTVCCSVLLCRSPWERNYRRERQIGRAFAGEMHERQRYRRGGAARPEIGETNLPFLRPSLALFATNLRRLSGSPYAPTWSAPDAAPRRTPAARPRQDQVLVLVFFFRFFFSAVSFSFFLFCVSFRFF
jgi:hypothetical protein